MRWIASLVAECHRILVRGGIERIRKGPLDAAAERLVALARHRMAAKTTAQPSKPDDLSLILYRKPPAPASPRPGKDS